MFELLSNTRRQGDLGVAAAIFYFTKIGWAISKPLADSQRYDLIVDDGSTLYRVECKTTSFQPKGNAYQVQLSTSGGNQSWDGIVKKISKNDSDLLFILTESGQSYVVPTEDLDNTTKFSLGPGADKYLVEGDSFKKKESIVYPKRPGSQKIDWPEIEVVLDALSKTNYTQYGKVLGVSDNAVRNYVRTAGYDPKTLEKLNKV